MLTVDDFDFSLPTELIAQHPAPERRSSRLLQVAGTQLGDLHFPDLPGLLAPGDLLVFNDTRVIRARLFGQKASGGKIEVLIERILDARHALAQIRASKSPKPGTTLLLADAFDVKVTARAGNTGEFFMLELPEQSSTAKNTLQDFWQLISDHGQLPLPPYIQHPASHEDEARYQTVFAREPGAVAAPTAGLHFDQTLLDDLQTQGIKLAWLTLHVGAGTFQPVRTQYISEHAMHSERFEIPARTVDAIAETKARGGRVVAVGTTSLRALESASRTGSLRAGASETDIFITPGFTFHTVDRLITNFHLPKSTLLMLVSAFAGYDTIRRAYAHAITHRYRFFSYGDAMLLEKS